ncbi:MAG TPA: hypothetical protein VN714_30895 [Trebonia sp.]|jgi:hypothetical protein|nr:hypothetical protein [Trebonia sp.]
MSDVIAKRDRRLGGFVPGRPLDSYRDRFAGHFALERRDGVLVIRAHRDGQSALWSRGLLGDSLRAVVTALAQWATDHDEEIKAARQTFDNR